MNLYQEINIIFNFSEQLAQTIEPEAIAKITLAQAMHSTAAHSGVIVLWDDTNKALLVPAMEGETMFNDEKLKANMSLLLKIGLSEGWVAMVRFNAGSFRPNGAADSHAPDGRQTRRAWTLSLTAP